jgi:7,8-dihydropterin-6-yl-methyl-4-(beta-D-ribofuranosyl)aminobenzene 5'-phosphate synthase
MITRRHLLSGSGTLLLASFGGSAAWGESLPARVTILSDAFGRPSNLKRSWGYSAFIEYGGRRILFDTGGYAADFAHNTSELRIDLKRLDFAVITHRHSDHTGGLNHLLRENPRVTIYAPVEPGGFNTPLSPPLVNLIKRYVASVPDDLRYFGGNTPSELRTESGWSEANFVHVRNLTEVLPGYFLFSTQSETPGTREMNEISLVIRTPKGSILVVGCSHPGIEKILEAAVKIDPRIYAVFGGFHLVDMSDAEVTAMVTRFREKWGVERMAAGHCTGPFAFAELVRIYGDRFDRAGVGSVINLPG